MNVFISGSISIDSLPKLAIEKIDAIIRQNHAVLIGDANGADLRIQKHLLEKRYHNIRVYFAGGRVRNNVGNWVTKQIPPPSNEKGRALYTLKDKAMAHDADYGLMIWDGESQGTLNNILAMKTEKKKFSVIVKNMLVDGNNIDSFINATSNKKAQAKQLSLF
jgi:hypothetical protein